MGGKRLRSRKLGNLFVSKDIDEVLVSLLDGKKDDEVLVLFDGRVVGRFKWKTGTRFHKERMVDEPHLLARKGVPGFEEE